MSQRRPAAEYELLLDAIERLTFDLGRIEVELADLRHRAARLEARVVDLNRPVAAQEPLEDTTPEEGVAAESTLDDAAAPETAGAETVVPLLAASEPAVPEAAIDPGIAEPSVVEPAIADPAVAEPAIAELVAEGTSVPEPHALEPELDDQPVFVAAASRHNGVPVFTRIVAEPADERDEPVQSVALVPVLDPVFPVEHEPIWARVPERYRRAAWIAATLVAVMVVSTWITSADSPSESAPTPHTEAAAGIARTSTPEDAAAFGTATQPATPMSHAGMEMSPTRSASPVATSTGPAAATPTAIPPTPASTEPPSATTPATAAESPTVTAAATNTAPASTVVPTETPAATVAPTVAGQPGQIVPGGVGSTETTIVETFGTADGEQDGRSSYSEGSVLVTYGPGTLAMRVTFLLDTDDLTMSLTDARGLADYYRPPDAQLLSETTNEPGLIRRVYSSTTLGALFAGLDTGGRTADHYVEELRFDPATQRALSIEMALGDRP
ncbi:MAG TPA: hypothetical protein VFV93_02235 [Thermomicrobiales bacterium]|nr:hypothetical protein [Thermomicrobiales bacterium]